MFNPLQAALDSKAGQYLQGRSTVDNAANPTSALNMQKKLSPQGYLSPQAKQYQQGMDRAMKRTRTFGTPKI